MEKRSIFAQFTRGQGCNHIHLTHSNTWSVNVNVCWMRKLMVKVKKRFVGNHTQCSKGKFPASILKQKCIFWFGAYLTSVFAKSFKLRVFFPSYGNIFQVFIMEIILQRTFCDKRWNWFLLVNVYNWNRSSLS